jgi:hypothetical protein
MKCSTPRHSLSCTTALLILLLVSAVSFARLRRPEGNGGSKEKAAGRRKKKDEERKRKKKAEEPKPNYEPIISQILPNTVTTNPSTKDKDKEKRKREKAKEEQKPSLDYAYVKPGHFVSVMQNLKVNNFDYPGILKTYPTDANGYPLDVYKTNYRVTMYRRPRCRKGRPSSSNRLFSPQRENFARRDATACGWNCFLLVAGPQPPRIPPWGRRCGTTNTSSLSWPPTPIAYVGLKDPKIHSVVVSEAKSPVTAACGITTSYCRRLRTACRSQHFVRLDNHRLHHLGRPRPRHPQARAAKRHARLDPLGGTTHHQRSEFLG